MPECPSSLLERDFLSACGQLLVSENQSQGMFLAGLCITQDMDRPTQNIPPQIKKLIDPQVWDQGIPEKAKFVTPIRITSKETSNFPSRCQYPIKPEAQQGLQPLISKFIKYRLLMPCQSPCNTPALLVFSRNPYLHHPFKIQFQTFLVAQWLRICLPMQGTRVRSLFREDPTRRGATKPMRHNY